jgi:hypothetical protein
MSDLTTVAMGQVVCDWITSLGWDASEETGYSLSPGTEIHDNPDKIVFIITIPGPGYTTEEPATDAKAFQARVRGPADDPLAAEMAATLLDHMILGASFPAVIDGVPIVHVHRVGATPVALPLDPKDKRFEYTCNYVIITGA